MTDKKLEGALSTPHVVLPDLDAPMTVYVQETVWGTSTPRAAIHGGAAIRALGELLEAVEAERDFNMPKKDLEAIRGIYEEATR